MFLWGNKKNATECHNQTALMSRLVFSSASLTSCQTTCRFSHDASVKKDNNIISAQDNNLSALNIIIRQSGTEVLEQTLETSSLIWISTVCNSAGNFVTDFSKKSSCTDFRKITIFAQGVPMFTIITHNLRTRADAKCRQVLAISSMKIQIDTSTSSFKILTLT